jgi:hypothetical protein
MERTDYLDMTNIGDPAYGKTIIKCQTLDNIADRRSHGAILLYIIMIFICIVEGLYLVYRQELAFGGTGGMVACFYVDKIMESLVVATILVYGQFHTLESPQHRWFWALCGMWCIVIIMSVVPVLASVPVAEIAVAVEHPALSIFYCIAAGFVFYTSIYFIFVNRERTDRCEMIWRLVTFGIGLWVPFVTGMFM